jgi:hypothetical protein
LARGRAVRQLRLVAVVPLEQVARRLETLFAQCEGTRLQVLKWWGDEGRAADPPSSPRR